MWEPWLHGHTVALLVDECGNAGEPQATPGKAWTIAHAECAQKCAKCPQKVQVMREVYRK